MKCTPASDLDLADFERRLNVSLPSGLAELYRRSDGTPYGNPDEAGHRFWSICELRPDEDYSWAVVFADHREESWWYGIDLTGRGCMGIGAVYLLGEIGRPALYIASSFEDFVRLYLKDDQRLYLSGAHRHDAASRTSR